MEKKLTLGSLFDGSVLVIAEDTWNSVKIVHCKSGVVDGEKIKADTWYTLRNGEFSEVGE